MKQDVAVERRGGILPAGLGGGLAGEHHAQVLGLNCLRETPRAAARCLTIQNRELGSCMSPPKSIDGSFKNGTVANHRER